MVVPVFVILVVQLLTPLIITEQVIGGAVPLGSDVLGMGQNKQTGSYQNSYDFVLENSWQYYFPESTLTIPLDQLSAGNSPGMSPINGTLPDQIVFDSQHREVYVYSPPVMYAINASDDTITSIIDTGFSSSGQMIFDPLNGHIYATNDAQLAGSVSILSGEIGTKVSSVRVGSEPHGEALVPSRDQIYVADFHSNAISILDGATDTVVRTLNTIDQPYSLVYDPINGNLFVYGAGTLSELNVSGNNIVSTLHVGNSSALEFNQYENVIYVAHESRDFISVIDPSTDTLIRDINGFPPSASITNILYDPGTNQLFVADTGINAVSVINAATDTLVANVSVGISPRGLAYDPYFGSVYVADRGSSSISIIHPTYSDAPVYPVSFGESGLPPGSVWSITGPGTHNSGPIRMDVFVADLSVGSHIFTISGPPGYLHEKELSLNVSGDGTAVSIIFTPDMVLYYYATVSGITVAAITGAVTALLRKRLTPWKGGDNSGN